MQDMGVARQITTRHAGPALVVGTPALREKLVSLLTESNFTVTEADDPYAAMAELCRHSPPYAAIVFSLAGLYRDELHVIAVVRRRFPEMEIWLADLEGRSAALADAMRLGATGLLDDDGLHRLQEAAPSAPVREETVSGTPTPAIAEAEPAAPAGRNGNRRSARVEREVVEPPSEEREPARASPAGPRRRRRAPSSSSAPVPKAKENQETPHSPDEPVLTAEELRALLQDQPGLPPLGQD
jgi:hypothetical protein